MPFGLVPLQEPISFLVVVQWRLFLSLSALLELTERLKSLLDAAVSLVYIIWSKSWQRAVSTVLLGSLLRYPTGG